MKRAFLDALVLSACLLGASAAPASSKLDACKAITYDADAVACTSHLIESGALRGDASAEALRMRAKLYAMDVVQPGLALADLDKLVAMKPKLAEAYRQRGFVFQALGRYSHALADFDKAIALQPDFVEAIFLRAETLFAMRRYDRAIAEYEKAAALRPALAPSFDIRRKEGRDLALLFGPSGPAKADTANLIMPGRDTTRLFAACNDATHAEALRCGKIMLVMADYEDAVVNYRLAFPVPGLDSGWEFDRGHGKAAQGFVFAAVGHLDRAIASQPNPAEAWYLRALVGYHGYESERARGDLDRAIALKPDYAEAYILRALVKRHAKDAAGAKADAQKAVKLLGK
jgi:tetratricopeptide (TPR) repeat protein